MDKKYPYYYESKQQDVLYRLIYYTKSALHISGDGFAHHQEHLTVFTVSGNVHPSCCPAGVPNDLKLNYVDCETCIHNLSEHYQIL